MKSYPEPISVWDVIDDPDSRPVVEARLQSGTLALEFFSVDGPRELDGSQGCLVASLDTGETVVIKRSDQTIHGVVLGPEGRQWVRNEAAAYAIAKLLGMEDLVLPTVFREAELPGGVKVEVAVRLFVEPSDEGKLDEGAPLVTLDVDQLARAAIFDRVVEQPDRKIVSGHGGNWYVLREPGRAARLLLFDHQQCFGGREGFGLESGIWDVAAHQIAPYVSALTALLTQDARDVLSKFLDDEQLEGVIERARALLPADTEPGSEEA